MADGTGSETTNSFVGVAHYANGTIAEGVSLWLIDENIYSSGSFVDSTVTDDEGNFILTSSISGTFSVQISGTGEVAYRGGFISDGGTNSLGTVTLSRGSTVSGVIKGGGVEAQILRTTYRTAIAADGSFEFKDVPPGGFAILADGIYCGGFSTKPQEVLDLDTLLAPVGYMVVDDFRFANDRSSLAWLVPGSDWEVSHSPETVISPEVVDLQFNTLISHDDSWEGRSLNLSITPKTVNDSAELDLRLPLGRDWEHWDLSKLSEITLMTKGSGTIRLYLETNSSEFTNLGWDISLTKNWEEQSLAISDLTAERKLSSEEVEAALESVGALGFSIKCSGSDTLHFQTDNITLINIETLDFFN
jgi:hypothetical protein